MATAGLPLVHVTTRPWSALPDASSAAALSVVSSPTTSDNVGALTWTDAAPAPVTVIVAEALNEPLVARKVVEPTATALTSPVLETVATDGVVVAHEID